MDIVDISKIIYKDDPKSPRSINLQIDSTTENVNEIYEVLVLFLLEGINNKVLPNINKLTQNNFNDFMKKNISLIQKYFMSIGCNFNCQILSKKQAKKYNYTRVPNFYVRNKYNFDFCLLHKYYKNGKTQLINYNPKRKMQNLIDSQIILRVYDRYLCFTFKYL